MSKIALIYLACLRGWNVTIVESSETYGKLKGPVQKLFSIICFLFYIRYKVVKFGLNQWKFSKIASFSLACLRG